MAVNGNAYSCYAEHLVFFLKNSQQRQQRQRQQQQQQQSESPMCHEAQLRWIMLRVRVVFFVL